MKYAHIAISSLLLGFTGFAQAQSTPETIPNLAFKMEPENISVNSKSMKNAADLVFSTAAFRVSTSAPDLATYINLNLHYPQDAAQLGISGTVIVSFDILPNGSLANFAILESPNQGFDAEVIKLLKAMPAWKPALAGTTPIKSSQQLKVNFSLR